MKIKQISLKALSILGLTVLLITNLSIYSVNAEESTKEDNTNKYYYSDVVNTGLDNGYKNKGKIKNGDPHYGWKLGSFVISGYTSQTTDENGKIVFLKTVGDTITFTFNLDQNINKLNGKKDLSIASDKKGWDEEFQIKPTAFKKGALIIKKTDYQNNEGNAQLYTDYLNGIKKGANTKVEIFEEGDYEVALDYEIFEDRFAMFNKYHDYRIRFSFSIRNGNCMVFPIDIKTGQELTNTSVTENGFYLDLAKSKYLDIIVKKENLTEGANGFVEDTRFNKPAKDGEKFTEEGIYTIIAKNPQTDEKTEKRIYVGTNSVIKAHMQTGYSINDINNLVATGATIDNDGHLTLPQNNSNISTDKSNNSNSNTKSTHSDTNLVLIISLAVATIIVIVAVLFILKNFKNKGDEKHEN